MCAEELPESSGDSADYIRSVLMENWDSVLAAPIQLELNRERTVIVGKNAAGKSVILESIVLGCFAAVLRGRVSTLGPQVMRLELSLGGERIVYEYRWRLSADPDISNNDSSAEVGDDEDLGALLDDDADDITWEEVCRQGESGAEIWRVREGVAVLSDGRQLAMPPENGLLRLKDSPSLLLPPDVGRIQRLIRGIHLIPAGMPRSQPFRGPMRLYKHAQSRKKGRAWRSVDQRAFSAMSVLLTYYENDGEREIFNSVVEIGRRLGLLRDIDVRIEEMRGGGEADERPTHMADILVDGTDFGYLSDGTLRILEIIVALVSPAIKVLLLEEPETGVHPGLLKRVLAELDAHSCDKQLIITTHSPVVVDWAHPEEIRLVERGGGQISVRPLSPVEIDQIAAYLDDDLSISDYIYSGAME